MKRKWKIFLAIGIVIIAAAIIIIPRFTKYHLPIAIKAKPKEINKEFQFIKQKAKELKQYCKSHQYSTSFACILDMNQHSGKKRFYVYDFEKDTIVSAGLVAHGSCNEYYLSKAKFSNIVGCGCSAYGRYKIGNSYPGRFGKAYKLYGLDTSNNNAFERNIVLHAYDCVPDEASYPQPICNSLGCTMVSYNFLKTVSNYIDKTKKPLVLWMLH
jgi:hypothetical protein